MQPQFLSLANKLHIPEEHATWAFLDSTGGRARLDITDRRFSKYYSFDDFQVMHFLLDVT
jgi:hypothetical protein